MLTRLQLQSFGCFESLDWSLDKRRCVALLGLNGSGKSTILRALALLQAIGAGHSGIGGLLQKGDLNLWHESRPLLFCYEVELDQGCYRYELELEWPNGFRQFRVKREALSHNSIALFERDEAEVKISSALGASHFRLDRPVLALPIIKPQASELFSPFLKFCHEILVLSPSPAQISGFTTDDNEILAMNGQNFAGWFTETFLSVPSRYQSFFDRLRESMPELSRFENLKYGDRKSIMLAFNDSEPMIPFGSLSAGEKCLVIACAIEAYLETRKTWLLAWDEPSLHLHPAESSLILKRLRLLARKGGQLVVTTQDLQVLQQFHRMEMDRIIRPHRSGPTTIQTIPDRTIPSRLEDALLLDEFEAPGPKTLAATSSSDRVQ